MNRRPTPTPEIEQLRIWQQNLNTSPFAQHDLLNSAKPTDWDVLAIQEPAISSNLKLAIGITSYWYPVYPTNHLRDNQPRSRSLLLISKKLSTNGWKEVAFKSADVTAIELTTHTQKIQIINVYNDGNHDKTIELLDDHLRALPRSTKIIMLGDFNRHHPCWDEPRNSHLFTEARLSAAEKLLDLLATYGLTMILPAGRPTHELSTTKNYSRLDNVFVTESLAEQLDLCTALETPRLPATDHFTVHTKINFRCEKATTVTQHDFRKTDWEAFATALKPPTPNLPTDKIKNVRTFDTRLKKLMDALKKPIEEKVPKRKDCPYTKRWWTKELTQLRRKRNKLSNRSQRHKEEPEHPTHAQYREAHALYQAEIKKSKQDCWNRLIDEADADDLWTAHKYLTSPNSDGGAARIPILTTKDSTGKTNSHSSNKDKSTALYETFFPLPTLPDDPPNESRPPEVEKFRPITTEQLLRIISKLRPYKAPGPDGIPNCVYMQCRDLLVPILIPLFRATFTLNYYPQAWRESTTVVLRKPEKPDYSVPKAYRPIALLNVISKLLSACVAENLNRLAERWDLLPDNHFGGRRGRTTTDSMHTLTSFIKDAWRAGDVVAGLFLDVSGAFPNASPTTLARAMRAKGVPEQYVAWTERKLEGRTTELKFDDYKSDEFIIRHGIDQGCPLSCISYLFYNSGLIETARPGEGRKKGKEELAVGYIDDVALLVRARKMETATAKLKDMMEREGGALDWARAHTSDFALEPEAVAGPSNRSVNIPTKRAKQELIDRTELASTR